MNTRAKNIDEYILTGSNNVNISEYEDNKLMAYFKSLYAMMKDYRYREERETIRAKMQWIIDEFEIRYRRDRTLTEGYVVDLNRTEKKRFLGYMLSQLKDGPDTEKSELIKEIAKKIAIDLRNFDIGLESQVSK